MMQKQKRLLIMLAACTLLFSSCALLPVEESVRTAPVIKTYERKEYSTIQAMRGDLVQTAKVTCMYVPVQTATLSFSLSDEYIDKIMVQAGAEVEKGQLLAQLRLDDRESRLEEVNNTIAELNLRSTYLQKQHELALRRHEITSASLSAGEKAEALEALQQTYNAQSQSIQDQLEIQQLTLDTLQEQIDLRQIRAPFSGVVSKVLSFEEGDKSSLNTSVITLVDSTLSLFKANTNHWASFRTGETYEITVKGQVFHATVKDAAELGLETPERIPGQKADVYFVLTDSALGMEGSKTGTIMLVLSEHLDVLYLPTAALSYSEGKPFVYYQREDGMKAIKYVETGVTVGDYTEITNGLNEGEWILADEESAY